ncbi:hypothetical protein [Natronorarus salvus]|uniref:hypothetical protein n=1 Tax=Natronorarus salvus TaxID=3117733 RepID=UPI002F26516E
MKPLWVAVCVALGGMAVLTVAVNVLDPDTPRALNALYNLWLLATIAVCTVGFFGACFRFFAFITGERK